MTSPDTVTFTTSGGPPVGRLLPTTESVTSTGRHWYYGRRDLHGDCRTGFCTITATTGTGPGFTGTGTIQIDQT